MSVLSHGSTCLLLISSLLTQLNVTASPSLPSGLQYNCSFSGSGDVFPVVVEAVEVVAGTEYQCNINQAINVLGVVQTGIEMVYIKSQQTCPRGL